jgi:dihydroorotate dehydrogenase (NAD+) catalytic subunit
MARSLTPPSSTASEASREDHPPTPIAGDDAVSIDFCGLRLAHPVINGSGTFDAIAARATFGDALERDFPFAVFVSKTITLASRAGNPPPRLWEAQAGLINSIGLPNKGLERYLREDLPELARLPVPLITNVMGSNAEEISELLGACDARQEIAAIELNVSCPNVHTGLDIGADPVQLQRVVAAVRPATSKPMIVKLTPNCADVAACAGAAQEGGADAVSLINTLRAIALAPTGRAHGPRRPRTAAWLGGGTGGLSGAAVRPVALAQIAAVAGRVSIPVVGMGGVRNAAHARQFLDVGATLVAVGTESFRNPRAASEIVRELAAEQRASSTPI